MDASPDRPAGFHMRVLGDDQEAASFDDLTIEAKVKELHKKIKTGDIKQKWKRGLCAACVFLFVILIVALITYFVTRPPKHAGCSFTYGGKTCPGGAQDCLDGGKAYNSFEQARTSCEMNPGVCAYILESKSDSSFKLRRKSDPDNDDSTYRLWTCDGAPYKTRSIPSTVTLINVNENLAGQVCSSDADCGGVPCAFNKTCYGSCGTCVVSKSVDVWLGNGCFWERQYAYANIELSPSQRPCLEGVGSATCKSMYSFGRSMYTVTSKVGYAGGITPSTNGKVCYHHEDRPGDVYSTLGHAEVTSVTLDGDKALEQFRVLAEDFFDSFIHLTGPKSARPDQDMDVGGEYRNLIGIPGGVTSEYYAALKRANINGMDLVTGQGNEPDVLDRVYVYDSKVFPFYLGEQYMQFHSNFFGDTYPSSYLKTLFETQRSSGAIPLGECPPGLHQ